MKAKRKPWDAEFANRVRITGVVHSLTQGTATGPLVVLRIVDVFWHVFVTVTGMDIEGLHLHDTVDVTGRLSGTFNTMDEQTALVVAADNYSVRKQ